MTEIGNIYVKISGQGVETSISGQYVNTSISGQHIFADISGQFIFVMQSGMEIWVDISGDIIALASGTGPVRAVTLSGSIIDISGATIQLTSGTGPIRVVTLSGSITNISGQFVETSVSGQPVTVDISGQTIISLVSGYSTIVSTELTSINISSVGPIEVLVSGYLAPPDVSGAILIALVSGYTAPYPVSGAIITADISGRPIQIYSPSTLAGGSYILPAGASSYLVSRAIVSMVIRAGTSNAGLIFCGDTTISTSTLTSCEFYLAPGDAIAMNINNPSCVVMHPTSSGDTIYSLQVVR